MGIAIVPDLDLDGPEAKMPPAPQDIDTAAVIAAIMPDLSAEMAIQTAQATERAFSYAEKLRNQYLKEFQAKAEELRAQIQTIGKPKIMAVQIDGERRKLSKPAHPVLADLIMNAKLGVNSLMVGPAGCGKSTAAEQLAEALGLEFGNVCLTAGASETWLFGRQTPGGFVEAPFSRMFREGGVFLADEFDAADANLLLSVNTAIENGHLFNPISGQTFKKSDKFVFVAAANTCGRGADHVYNGRNRLDGATLRRFDKIPVGYVPEIEEQLCPDEKLRKLLQDARAKVQELKASEIISSGCMARAHAQMQAGQTLERTLQKLTMGWPEQLVSQCGLNIKSFPSPKGTKKKKGDANEEASEEYPF